MPEVTFVITTRDNAETIRACVRSCRQQSDADVEIVVVDNHSGDGTPRLASAAGADHVYIRGPERSAQRNAGISLATAPVVVVVDSDMTATPGLAREVADLLGDRPRVGAAVIPELAAGEGLWAAARKLEKRLYLGDPAVEAARAFRVAAVEAVDGYDEALTGCEDFDLPDRIAAAGWVTGRISAPLIHHETVGRLTELFRKKRYYGRSIAAYRAKPTSRRLARWSLVTRPGDLARRPHVTATLALLKLVEAAGLLAGMADRHRDPAPA